MKFSTTTLALASLLATAAAAFTPLPSSTRQHSSLALFGKSGKKARGSGYGHPLDDISEAVGNTPMVKINRLAPEGRTIYAKCEFFNPLSSVKDRLALSIIETAEKEGKLKPGDTVIEATSGNTGIAVAMMCAQRGYDCVITMAEPFSVERRKLMRMLGAKVIVTPKAGKVSDCDIVLFQNVQVILAVLVAGYWNGRKSSRTSKGTRMVPLSSI